MWSGYTLTKADKLPTRQNYFKKCNYIMRCLYILWEILHLICFIGRDSETVNFFVDEKENKFILYKYI